MPTGTANVFGGLRAALLAGDDVADEHLLESFLARRDEAAFAALVRRHGRMVLGVCRRVLRHHQDAEDAFQATFLVLFRKAASLGRRDRLGNFLYGVAYRTALEARGLNARRRVREALTDQTPEAVADPEPDREGLDRLDHEVTRLPEKYRAAVVLCELEGRSRGEAARLLGVPEGTLSSRLATARKKLAERLARCGVALSAVLAAVVTADRASASPALAAATVRAAVSDSTISPHVSTLVKGVLNAMFLTTIKQAGLLVLAVAATVAGVGVLSHQALASKLAPPTPHARADKKPDKTEQGPTITGVLRSVDAGKGALTATVATEPGTKKTEEMTFAVAKDLKVILEDSPVKVETPPEGKLSDLTEGTSVRLTLSPDKKTVVSLTARGPSVPGRVKAVDATKGTLTFETKSKQGAEEQTVSMVKGAKVLLNDGLSKQSPDKESELKDLAEGTAVQVQLTVDRKSAVSVRVTGGTVQGRLKGLDNGNGTVTIEVKEDGGLAEKTFSLAKDAQVEGNPSPGDGVVVQLSVFDKKVAVRVRGGK